MDLYAVNEHHRTQAGNAQTAMQKSAKAACKNIAKHLKDGGMRAKPGKQECPKKKKHT
jgi:hypothetical protein